MTAPYQALSRVYDAGWADFSIQYAPLVTELLEARGLRSARVLDLGCGTGVLALALARAGHAVRGVDASLPMLRVARRNARGVPGVRFVRGDLVAPQPGGPYDVAVCAYDAINYLRRLADLKTLFRNVAAVLRPGGLFLLDSNTVVMYRHQSGATMAREAGGLTVLETTDYNPRYKLATTTFSFPDGTYEVHRQRPYSFDELAPLLEAAGLRVTDRFSWFSRLPYTPASPKVFIIAAKSEPETGDAPPMADTIIMYGTTWCPDCSRAKRILERHNVPYTWINIEEDAAARNRVQEINGGYMSVPTILFPDGSVLVEPGNKELETKIGV